MERSGSARYEAACSDAADDLENEARNIHEHVSSSFVGIGRITPGIIIHPGESFAGLCQKKPALRRQRIHWRRRVGDASAKPTSAVKLLGRCDFMTVLRLICSCLPTETSECFHPVPLIRSKRRFVFLTLNHESPSHRKTESAIVPWFMTPVD